MSFLSGRNDNFKFKFPKVFVPEQIEKKYEPLLNRIPGNLCNTVIDFINGQIKNVELNIDIEAEEIEQIDRGTPQGRISRSDAVPDMLWKRDVRITFELDSTYIIWLILADLYLYYYCLKDKYIPKTPGMQVLDGYGNVVYRIEFMDMIYKGLSGLEFDFSQNTVDQKIVTTSWKANKVDIVFEASKF